MIVKYLVPGWIWHLRDGALHFGVDPMPRADLSTFVPLSDTWARDATRVYCFSREMRDADISTFRVLNSLYAKDSNFAYTMAGKIKGADAETFEVVGPIGHPFNTFNGYAKDRNQVFFHVQGGKVSPLKGADPNTFRTFGNGFASDASTVYCERTKLHGAKPADWIPLLGPYSRSGGTAYFRNEKIAGARADQLVPLPIIDYNKWSRAGNDFFCGSQPGDSGEYLAQFRECFVFRGRATNIKLRWMNWQADVQLDPLDPIAWQVAGASSIELVADQWLQQPKVQVKDHPQLGNPIWVPGTDTELLTEQTWLNEDRVWVLRPVQMKRRAKLRDLFPCDAWHQYSQLDQLPVIEQLIADAAV
ncbi:DKNYY domain-containing protein [Anatilimnocola sp. NA78]|uniref:DKNYY domain-containing protein n=1 Tax=Anatilimnocola sp. NA78 TaxID=3415683 RepID=UPI003CE509FD